MKKFLLVLALASCMLGVTACGAETEEFPYTVDEMEAQAEEIMSLVSQCVEGDVVATAVSSLESYYGTATGEAFESACEIYAGSADEIGAYVGMVEGTLTISGDISDYTLAFEIEGESRNATIELYYDDGDNVLVPDMMVSPSYTLGEKMSKAGLNTLMGMGTVFCVLILIMCLIYLLGTVPKIEAKLAANKAAKTEKASAPSAAEKAVDNTIAQIVEKEANDEQLIAVIAAAIAAYESEMTGGYVSADSFVVRSIKRANTNKWQKA